MVVVLVKLAGLSSSCQDGRDAVQRPGDIIVLDHGPSALTTHKDSQDLFLEVPRERLERALGSTQLYTGLSIGMPAYGCGFVSQAHFAGRFKDRHGTTPRAYRQAALLGAP